MITAEEARALNRRPFYTEEETEKQIRERAPVASYTCFDLARVSPVLQQKLAEKGFVLTPSADSLIVAWDA